MQKQAGACAFTNACTNPGPRFRLEGTNRFFCGAHSREMQLPIFQASSATEFSGVEFHPPRSRKRGSWATGVGMAGVV